MTNETEDAMKRGPRVPPEAPKSTSRSFFRPEPISNGTDKRKLKRVASSRESPVKSPPEMVAPDREIPGTKARL